MCVCVCVCVKAKCVDISAQIATKLHTRTKILPTAKTCVQFSNCTSKVVETAFRHASIGVRCELV